MWFCIFWRATQILCVWIVLNIYHNFYGCFYNIDHTTLCYSTLYEHVAFPFLHTYVTVLVVHIYTTSFAIVYTCWLSVICLPPPCGFSILDQWSFYLVFSIDYSSFSLQGFYSNEAHVFSFLLNIGNNMLIPMYTCTYPCSLYTWLI